ncbi:hypothetical protein Tco_0910526 [Tanacetum coccineum]|uniref:Uncharacterized protein n=1 Tax=Tanacetum coccineum TaxID=301880 RepID=A0ABQ5CT52_9ASTR
MKDIDWTMNLMLNHDIAMMALTGVEQDDWSIEFDAEHMHFGQDGLGDFDWSNKADDAPVSLALMATNSEVPYCSKCSKSYKLLLENYQKERDNFQRARTEILGYQMSLESLEVMLKTHEKNEYAWGDKYEQMEYDLKIRDLKLEEKQKELDQVLKERDDFKVKLEKCKYMESDISSGNETVTDSTNENLKEKRHTKQYLPYRWVDSDDEETDISESQKETVFNTENSEESFENSPNHLIKDCNLHERTSQHTQTHKSKGTQGSRGTRPVWNNIQRVNHSNFARNSRNPHQRRSFIPSAVLTRDGLISTVRPKMTQAVPSKSTANVTYQGAARSRVPQAVLSRSTDRKFISKVWIIEDQNLKNTHHHQGKERKSTVGSQAVLPQTVKKSAMISNPEKISRTMLSLTWMLWKYDRRQRIKLSELKSSKVVMCALEMTLKNIIPSGESLCGIARQHKMKLPMAQKTGGKSTSNINEL